MIVAGLGMGGTFAPLTTVAMREVEPRHGRRGVRHAQHGPAGRLGDRHRGRGRAAAEPAGRLADRRGNHRSAGVARAASAAPFISRDPAGRGQRAGRRRVSRRRRRGNARLRWPRSCSGSAPRCSATATCSPCGGPWSCPSPWWSWPRLSCLAIKNRAGGQDVTAAGEPAPVRWPGPSARPARPVRWARARAARRAPSRRRRARGEPVREGRLQVGEPAGGRVEPGEKRRPDQARVAGLDHPQDEDLDARPPRSPRRRTPCPGWPTSTGRGRSGTGRRRPGRRRGRSRRRGPAARRSSPAGPVSRSTNM